MTNEELAELERLLAKATPGEWIAQGWGDGSTPDGVTNIFNHDAEVLLMECLPVDDAALIVALRNAAPSLTATAREAEALRAENARLQARADAARREALEEASKVARDYASKAAQRGWVLKPGSIVTAARHIATTIRALKGNPNG